MRVQLGDVGGGEEANADDRGRAQQAADALQPSHARHEPVGERQISSPLYALINLFVFVVRRHGYIIYMLSI